jgi:hypothetical protein
MVLTSCGYANGLKVVPVPGWPWLNPHGTARHTLGTLEGQAKSKANEFVENLKSTNLDADSGGVWACCAQSIAPNHRASFDSGRARAGLEDGTAPEWIHQDLQGAWLMHKSGIPAGCFTAAGTVHGRYDATGHGASTEISPGRDVPFARDLDEPPCAESTSHVALHRSLMAMQKPEEIGDVRNISCKGLVSWRFIQPSDPDPL